MRNKVLSILACLCLAAVCAVALPITASAQTAGGGALNYGSTLLSEDFSQIETAGDFTVKDGKIVMESDAFAAYTLPVTAFTEDFEMTVDVNFPVDKNSFFGFNIFGMTSGEDVVNNTFECSVHAYDASDAYVNDHANGKSLYLYSGGNGAKLVRGETAKIVMRKVGRRMTIIVNDVVAVDGRLPKEVTLTATGANIFVADQTEGMTIDNLIIREVIASTDIDSVTVTSNKATISTMQSATLTAAYTPDLAKAETYKWYVNDVLQNSSTEAVFEFASAAVDSYSIKCAVNDVMSDAVTISVTEASDDEKNALYFENFDESPNDAAFGGFKVADGKIVSNAGNYTRYDFPFNFVQNFDASVDVIFTDEVSENGAYAGITVSGIDEAGYEAEFNLRRMPDQEEEIADHAVIKYNGNEKYFSYDEERGGKLNDFGGFEPNVAYKLRVVRYDDQFEVYINETLALKSYLADPQTPTNMFIFSISGSVTFDNIVVKAAQEITDRVEPPKVAVAEAYITASNISPKVGEKITLKAECSPFDATPATYQWYVNDTIIEGATAATYEFTPTQDGKFVFKCVVDSTVTSEVKEINVQPADDGKKDKGGCGAMLLGGGGGIGLGLTALTLLGLLFLIRPRKKSVAQ